MKQENFLDYAALREWQAEIISYEKMQQGYLLQTTRGSRMLYIVGSEQEARSAFAKSEHLLMHGFAKIARPIANRFGEYLVPAFNGYYYLTDAFVGSLPQLENEAVCIQTASLLGAFHKAAKGYKPDGMPSVSFAGAKIAKRLLQLQGFACLDLTMEQNLAYLLQSTATALASFNPQKEARLKKLYRKRGGFNLGGKISLLQCQGSEIFISDISLCRAGGGICDLSELLLQIGSRENYAGQRSLQALKAYNREIRLEKDELDLLFAALLLPTAPLRAMNRYLRGESELGAMQLELAAACEEEKEKNRWAKRLLL